MLSAFIISVFGLVNLCPIALGSYTDILDTTINADKDNSLSSAVKWDVATWRGSDLFNNQVLAIVGYIIDFFIVIWIAVAFFGGYKIMTSDKEETMKEWIRLVIFGVLWVIIMVSARFLAEWLVWDRDGIINTAFGMNWDHNWVNFAKNLYEKIMFPFIKTVLYLVVWALFFMMAAKVIGFVTATDDAAKKKAGWIIIWCVVWILIVVWAKQLVEAIMWAQNKVLNTGASWISGEKGDITTWMWNDILWFENIPLIAQVINRILGLTMFAILALVIIQGYKMFTKPDDPKNRESLKKTLLYLIIWILVIGAAYAISNVLVINKLS